jgi:hypothetical protein
VRTNVVCADVFALLGQSNMAGRGQLVELERAPIGFKYTPSVCSTSMSNACPVGADGCPAREVLRSRVLAHSVSSGWAYA